MPSTFGKYDLKQATNTPGRMTVLGISIPQPEVVEATAAGMNQYSEMKDLANRTGDYIAKSLEVGGVTVVSCVSAGITLPVAGVLAKDSDRLLENPHITSIEDSETVLSRGHSVNFGVSVGTMVMSGDGKLAEASYTNECSVAQLAAVITPYAAAILYTKSYHYVQKSMLSTEQAAVVVRTHDLPLIVDATTEEDLQYYYRADADLVIYSGTKAIEKSVSDLVISRT